MTHKTPEARALDLCHDYARLTAVVRQKADTCQNPSKETTTDVWAGDTCWGRLCTSARDVMRDNGDGYNGSSYTFDEVVDGVEEGDLCPSCDRWANVQRPEIKRAKLARGNVLRRIVALGRRGVLDGAELAPSPEEPTP